MRDLYVAKFDWDSSSLHGACCVVNLIAHHTI